MLDKEIFTVFPNCTQMRSEEVLNSTLNALISVIGLLNIKLAVDRFLFKTNLFVEFKCKCEELWSQNMSYINILYMMVLPTYWKSWLNPGLNTELLHTIFPMQTPRVI